MLGVYVGARGRVGEEGMELLRGDTRVLGTVPESVGWDGGGRPIWWVSAVDACVVFGTWPAYYPGGINEGRREEPGRGGCGGVWGRWVLQGAVRQVVWDEGVLGYVAWGGTCGGGQGVHLSNHAQAPAGPGEVVRRSGLPLPVGLGIGGVWSPAPRRTPPRGRLRGRGR